MERVVLITGAGSGIGLASALEAARLGFRVVATTRTEEELDAVRKAVADAHLPSGEVEAEVLDVTDEEQGRRLLQAHRPWALVNNAAVVNAGLVIDTPPDEARHQFDVMVHAPIRLAQLALPGMRRAGGGRIVNISSIASDTTVPMLGWYQAAKAALSSVSDVLRQEVAHFGIEVVLIEPGIIDTPIWGKTAEDLRRRRAVAPETQPYDEVLDVVEEIDGRGTGDAEVARVVGTALHAGKPRFRYRVGAAHNALPLVNRFIPTSLRDRVGRKLEAL
jgi:NAD(P)-dependent dehydrogenase (short-subunit alcohol dehydrogenase family)